MANDQLISVAECAAIFGISPRAIYLWCQDGRLRQVRLSQRCIRVRRSDVERLIDERSSLPRAPRAHQKPIQGASASAVDQTPQWVGGEAAKAVLKEWEGK